AATKRIVPLFDRVLVQKIKPVERTASGLFIPEKAQESLNEAVVIAVGPGAPDKDGAIRPLAVKEGDRVLLPPFGGNALKFGQDEYTLYRDSELLAKLE
ncbi:chaperonin 10-like protein, partial [Entophlyctis helioformis]